MMRVDRSPVVAAYARMSPGGDAEPQPADSAMPPGCLEFIQLIVDSTHKVIGAITHKADQAHEVKETTYHYFDHRYNTVCVRHELKWLDNRCAFSYAIRNDFHYYFPPRSILLEYTTFTDAEGTNLNPDNCVFPSITREMEMYPHLDMLLLLERIKM